MGAETQVLFTSHPHAIVKWNTMGHTTQKYMKSRARRDDSEETTTLKEFIDGLPTGLKIDPSADLLYHWGVFLTSVSNSNPTFVRIEIHFLSECDCVITFAIDDGVAWYNVYNKETTNTIFFSKNKRWFRPPINEDFPDDERVFDVKKYKVAQARVLFDESTRFDTLYSREVEKHETMLKNMEYVMSYIYAR
jgi:hypothetical protein